MKARMHPTRWLGRPEMVVFDSEMTKTLMFVYVTQWGDLSGWYTNTHGEIVNLPHKTIAIAISKTLAGLSGMCRPVPQQVAA